MNYNLDMKTTKEDSMNNSLIERISALDPDLAEEAQSALIDAETAGNVRKARRNVQDTMDRYAYDATGQDGEDEINASIEDYCDSQSDRIRRTDPDRWSEMRFMGLV